MKKLKVYVAGKVNPNSVFGTSDWRDGFCKKLGELAGFEIQNLDPTKSNYLSPLHENNSAFIFGRDCFLISVSDVVIVQLTDDISVGGSQEMIIAKYFGKPLIGIAKINGKFRKKEKNIQGRIYYNYTQPFVASLCDSLVEDINGAADFMKEFFNSNRTTNTLTTILCKNIFQYEKILPNEVKSLSNNLL